MKNDPEKDALRRLLLEKRDNTSFDFHKISAKQIQKNLKKIPSFLKAKKVGAYYPIGSEVRTQDIMQEILSNGVELFLPRVNKKTIEFRRITGFDDLEKASFDVLEPKEECPIDNELDIVLVPTVGITPEGVRLGYGQGFYDRFLESNKVETISLVLEKQVVKNIPHDGHDRIIDWVATEERVFQTHK